MREDSFYKCISISYQFSSIYLDICKCIEITQYLRESDKISSKSG